MTKEKAKGLESAGNENPKPMASTLAEKWPKTKPMESAGHENAKVTIPTLAKQ